MKRVGSATATCSLRFCTIAFFIHHFMKEVGIVRWYIQLYKNPPDELKTDCDKEQGLYIAMKWTEHLTSIRPFSIGNFVNVVIKKDASW